MAVYISEGLNIVPIPLITVDKESKQHEYNI